MKNLENPNNIDILQKNLQTQNTENSEPRLKNPQDPENKFLGCASVLRFFTSGKQRFWHDMSCSSSVHGHCNLNSSDVDIDFSWYFELDRLQRSGVSSEPPSSVTFGSASA